MMQDSLMAAQELGLAARERALVNDLVRYLDRVAFVPRDLVVAHASGRVGADAFDRYRTSCERVTGPIRDAVWAAVIDALFSREVALAVRV